MAHRAAPLPVANEVDEGEQVGQATVLCICRQDEVVSLSPPTDIETPLSALAVVTGEEAVGGGGVERPERDGGQDLHGGLGL